MMKIVALSATCDNLLENQKSEKQNMCSYKAIVDVFSRTKQLTD